jgi:hypothetical protein
MDQVDPDERVSMIGKSDTGVFSLKVHSSSKFLGAWGTSCLCMYMGREDL